MNDRKISVSILGNLFPLSSELLGDRSQRNTLFQHHRDSLAPYRSISDSNSRLTNKAATLVKSRVDSRQSRNRSRMSTSKIRRKSRRIDSKNQSNIKLETQEDKMKYFYAPYRKDFESNEEEKGMFSDLFRNGFNM